MLSALTRPEAAAHPRVVIVGAGFGGLSAAKELGGTAFEVTLIDQHNYHLFQPLLHQVATAGLAPFRYRDFGSLATIGRKRAVADLGGLKVKGFLAWMLWSLAHIYFLIGFRSRLIVAMNWAWNYVTFQRGTRLITGICGSRLETMPRPQQISPAPEAARNVA
ncbi:MAG: FAD-dependent oxidoreductase [Methyloceanibacter sp.]